VRKVKSIKINGYNMLVEWTRTAVWKLMVYKIMTEKWHILLNNETSFPVVKKKREIIPDFATTLGKTRIFFVHRISLEH
jgi:hypothetical protein